MILKQKSIEKDGKGEIQSWTRKLNIIRTDRDKKDLFDLMLKGSRSSCFVFLLWDMKWRYIEVEVEHYLLFMLSPPKISWTVKGIKNICLLVLIVFYLTKPSNEHIICFDFEKQNSAALPYHILSNLNEMKVNQNFC